jgi:hypothetical protein
MPSCPRLTHCLFFNNRLKNMPAIADMTRAEYCRSGQHENCARFQVSTTLGPAGVPDNLFPDQVNRVATVVKNAKENASKD